MTQSDKRLLSLIFLSFAVLHEFGNRSSVALASVLVSLLFAVLSLSPKPSGPPLARPAGILLVIALAATTVLYSRTLDHPVFLWTFAVLAVALLIHMTVARRTATIVAFVLAAGALAAGIVANFTWGLANIDVFQFQQRAAQALAHGDNPYTPVVSSPNVLPPGVARWIPLHFPYGPVLPVLEAPFRLLGDIRVLHALAAVILSAAALLLARRAGTFDRTACVVMAFPLTVGMILFSWVDVITMAALATWFVSFRTHPRVATAALVVALAAKPTTLIALVPIFFWSVRARRQVVIGAGLAALFVLPFALVTGLSQFYYNVLGVQLTMLPRLDSLTVNSYLHAIGLPILPFAVSAVVIGAAAVMCLRHRPATYGDLFTTTAILATVSFLVAKWAYFNYYYIPAVLLMLAIAGDRLPLDAPELIRPPALLLSAIDGLRAVAGRLPGARRLPGAVLPAQHGREPQPERG
jgi:hypothetical protein